MNKEQQYLQQFERIIKSSSARLSNEKPSEWAEKHIIMPKPMPGKLRYSNSPYTREIIDAFAPDHPMRRGAVMKGAQLGFSATVLIPLVGWMIANRPTNTYLTVGAADLVDKAMDKIDLMIQTSGLRDYIKPQYQRKRNNKSGDTNTAKDYIGGNLTVTTVNNHKALRQVDREFLLLDDWESVKSSSKESGSTRLLIEQRAAAYSDTCKILYCSTPENKEGSNIEEVYNMGDKRKFYIPCPCCHELIDLYWKVTIDDKETGGIHYELDNHGSVIQSSVGYVCQKCAGFFKDNNKLKQLNDGIWKPTAKPNEPDFFSWQISSLYAPPGMYDWYRYAVNYNNANPQNQPRKEKEHQTFVNVVLGETYDIEGNETDPTTIQKNVRSYDIGTIPEKMAMSDGNGRIMLITFGADMNGKIDDARLDYEIVAWTETGASYSIQHGSIGTFIPREHTTQKRVDREHWTYELNKPNSVWNEVDRILETPLMGDMGGAYAIGIAGIDVGYLDYLAFAYMDTTNNYIVSLRGEKENQYMDVEKDVKYFKLGKARVDYFLLAVGFIKDDLAEYMKLRWDKDSETKQPNNFMNYPTPEGGLYLYENFFAHYGSEHRQLMANKTGGSTFRWVKKQSNSQNHLFDCRVYNMALKEIITYKMGREYKTNNFTWRDFCTVIKSTQK